MYLFIVPIIRRLEMGSVFRAISKVTHVVGKFDYHFSSICTCSRTENIGICHNIIELINFMDKTSNMKRYDKLET